MTDKDPKDMTASELLRQSDSNPCSMCHLVLAGDESCATTGCAEWAYLLADKIDAELAQARELSLLRGAELWAKANGWPGFRDGEDFGAWLDRCTLPRPRYEDGEVVGVREYEDIQGYCVYDDGEFFITTPNRSIDYAAGDRVKRPAPEALGADGKPIKAGETVWHVINGREATVANLKPWGAECDLADGMGESVVWAYESITHTPPDTQERIDGDAAKDHVEYWRCSGFDCAECPSKIDGEKPWERYECSGACCDHAMMLDLLRRQRELDKRKGGE